MLLLVLLLLMPMRRAFHSRASVSSTQCRHQRGGGQRRGCRRGGATRGRSVAARSGNSQWRQQKGRMPQPLPREKLLPLPNKKLDHQNHRMIKALPIPLQMTTAHHPVPHHLLRHHHQIAKTSDQRRQRAAAAAALAAAAAAAAVAPPLRRFRCAPAAAKRSRIKRSFRFTKRKRRVLNERRKWGCKYRQSGS